MMTPISPSRFSTLSSPAQPKQCKSHQTESTPTSVRGVAADLEVEIAVDWVTLMMGLSIAGFAAHRAPGEVSELLPLLPCTWGRARVRVEQRHGELANRKGGCQGREGGG